MTPAAPDWWQQPRRIAIVCDNDEWMRGPSEALAADLRAAGDDARFCAGYGEVRDGAVAVFLGCHGIAPPGVLARNRRNLVVHAGDLPRDRGWSPLTWQILAGRDTIPLCLLEAAADVDSGEVIFRSEMHFAGHELVDELRAALAEQSCALVRRFLAASLPPAGAPQSGAANYLPRRTPADSELDPAQSIAEQFNLLRVCDNERYPAFFRLRGHAYRLRIDKLPAAGDGNDHG